VLIRIRLSVYKIEQFVLVATTNLINIYPCIFREVIKRGRAKNLKRRIKVKLSKKKIENVIEMLIDISLIPE